jgi:hypothetical protein
LHLIRARKEIKKIGGGPTQRFANKSRKRVHKCAHLLFRGADFQSAVSPASSRQVRGDANVCGLEIRDATDWKSALQRNALGNANMRFCSGFF